jgi:hypothetical protein
MPPIGLQPVSLGFILAGILVLLCVAGSCLAALPRAQTCRLC